MPRDAWNPQQYERFRVEREQPFWDLASMLQLRSPSLAVDLGCGTGELTAALHRSLGAERTIGVDSSRAMLDRPQALADDAISFVLGDVRTWSADRPVDVVFSNAALQWVEDHASLFPRLIAMLRPGGEIAVQMPANFDHPSHRIAAELALEEPFAGALLGYRRAVAVLAVEEYATLLHEQGCTAQHVRLQVYGHELASSGDVVEWVRGTLLTDYESRMPALVFDAFLRGSTACDSWPPSAATVRTSTRSSASCCGHDAEEACSHTRGLQKDGSRDQLRVRGTGGASEIMSCSRATQVIPLFDAAIREPSFSLDDGCDLPPPCCASRPTRRRRRSRPGARDTSRGTLAARP